MTPYESARYAVSALKVIGLSFLPLGFFTVVILIRQFIIVPNVRKELLALHSRRVARARRALAEDKPDDDGAPTLSCLAPSYPFSGWLSLDEGGGVTIAGQTFRPGEAFAVTARDTNNIPRVKAASTGQEVCIVSHGQTYRANYTGMEWSVQLVEGVQP